MQPREIWVPYRQGGSKQSPAEGGAMGTGAAAMVQIRHVREPTSREGVAAHTARFDDDATVRNNARLDGDDRERALGGKSGHGATRS